MNKLEKRAITELSRSIDKLNRSNLMNLRLYKGELDYPTEDTDNLQLSSFVFYELRKMKEIIEGIEENNEERGNL